MSKVDWYNPLRYGADVTHMDPFEQCDSGEFPQRMQPNGMMWLRNDFWSILLTGVWAAHRLAISGSPLSVLSIKHQHPSSSGPELTLPVMPIDQFCETGWKQANLPDEMSFFLGLDFVEISGDPGHPPLMSVFEGDPYDLPDPSIIMNDLIETGGFLCPLLWANARYDLAHKSWMTRQKQAWYSDKVLWTSNPNSNEFNLQAGISVPNNPITGKINPVFKMTYLSINDVNSLPTLDLELNRVTNSVDFMLYHHHPIDYSVGRDNPTRIHVADPKKMSKFYHPRASWPSHLNKALTNITPGRADWESTYNVDLGELIGNWTGVAELQWQNPLYAQDFYETFLTYPLFEDDGSAGTDGCSTNAVMYVTTYVSSSGYRFLVPDSQFSMELSEEVAIMNYIPAKREYVNGTAPASLTPVYVYDVVGKSAEVVTSQFPVTVKPNEGTPQHQNVIKGFSFNVPLLKDRQTEVSTGFIEPTYGASTHLGSGLDVVLDLSLSGRQSPVLTNTSPVGLTHWDQSPASGVAVRNHTLRLIYPIGGAGLSINSHTPAVLPSGTVGPAPLFTQFTYDGVVLSKSDGVTHDYFELETLPATGLHSFIGAAHAFVASAVVDGWTVGRLNEELNVLFDEYSGALNIYSSLPGFSEGRLFSQLDSRFSTGGWSADDIHDRVVYYSISVATGSGKALFSDLRERVIKPEEVADWQNLLTNLLSI